MDGLTTKGGCFLYDKKGGIMLRLINQQRQVMPPVTKYKDLNVERVLDYDDRTLSFCIGNKNKPPAMQVCSQKALASRKNLHVIMSLRFDNQIQYNKEVSEWITTVYHTQNGHANII